MQLTKLRIEPGCGSDSWSCWKVYVQTLDIDIELVNVPVLHQYDWDSSMDMQYHYLTYAQYFNNG